MDQGESTTQDSADLDEVVTAIWGDRPADGPMEIEEPVVTEIWGHSPIPDPEPEALEDESTWPDLWGTPKGSEQAGREERRRRPPARARDDRGRYMLPESWVAPPQQKSPWRQRLHRP